MANNRKVQFDVELNVTGLEAVKRNLSSLQSEISKADNSRSKGINRARDIDKETKSTNGLLAMTKRLAGAYLGYQAVKKVVFDVKDIGKYMAKTQAFSHASEAQMKTLRDQITATSNGMGIGMKEMMESVMYLAQQMPIDDITKNLNDIAYAVQAIPNTTFKEASDLTVILSNNFKHTGKSIKSMLSDAVAGMDSAGISVHELTLYLQNAGGAAQLFKQDLTSVVAAAAALKAQGVNPAVAGTAVKNIMTTVLGGNQSTRKVFAEYGIDFKKDANGAVDFLATLKAIDETTNKLTSDQKTQFFSKAFGSFAGQAQQLSSQEGRAILAEKQKNMGQEGFHRKIAEQSMSGFYGEVTRIQTMLSNIPALFVEIEDSMMNLAKITRIGLEGVIDVIKKFVYGFDLLLHPSKLIQRVKEVNSPEEQQQKREAFELNLRAAKTNASPFSLASLSNVIDNTFNRKFALANPFDMIAKLNLNSSNPSAEIKNRVEIEVKAAPGTQAEIIDVNQQNNGVKKLQIKNSRDVTKQ